MRSSALRNSIPDILSEIAAGAKLLRAGQTTVKLPQGKSREHTLQRLGHDFSLEEIALEYTLLRRIILRLVKNREEELPPEESSFLHEVIDQAILEAAITYSAETSKKLKEEHLLLLAVIEQMPAAVLIAEAPSGRLLVANRQVQRIWGYPAAPLEDVRRHHRYHAFRKDGKQYPSTTWPLARAVEHGEVVSNEEAQVERADGEQRTVLISAAPVRDVDDKRTAAVAAVTDITAFREAQQAKCGDEIGRAHV